MSNDLISLDPAAFVKFRASVEKLNEGRSVDLVLIAVAEGGGQPGILSTLEHAALDSLLVFLTLTRNNNAVIGEHLVPTAKSN